MAKLLLVEDDFGLREELGVLLNSCGWLVEMATCAGDAEQLLNGFKFDMVLLDWNLPDSPGLALCSRVREAGIDVPMIFLTGRDSIEDKEAGFEAGADDYVVKPFDSRELLARMRTIQRRPRQLIQTPLAAKGISLNPYMRLVSAGDKTVHLSVMECALLEFFLRNRNRFFSAGELFAAVWPPSAEASDETVRSHVKFVRRKLALVGCEGIISTVKGAGYILKD